jgi:hypothetical protein
MPMLLENARLCLDCDTVFDEPRCPSCSSESFFPLSRWVRPHAVPTNSERPAKPARKAVRNTSIVLVGGGLAYALWRLLKSSDTNASADYPDKPNKK